jgi:O-antigen/teichoic acid export membrane protein
MVERGVAPGAATNAGAWFGLPRHQLQRVLGYGAARAVVELLIGARGILLAALLGPAVFGVWSLIRLCQQYLIVVGLGTGRGLEVEASAHRRGADGGLNATAERFAAASAGFQLLGYGAFSVLAAVGAVLTDDPTWRAILAGLAVSTLVERLYFQGGTFLRAQATIPEFATIELGHAALQLVLTVALAWLWGLSGAVAGLALAYAGGLAMMHGRVPMRIGWSWPMTRAMMRIGLPVTLAGLMQTLVGSLDRLVVAAFVSVEALGQYAFAVSVTSIGAAAGLVVRTAVFPDVYHAARHGDPGAWMDDMERMLLALSWILSLVLAAMALAVGPVIRHLLPEYVMAIGPARIFIFSGVAQGLIMVAMLGSVAADRQRVVPVLTAITLFASVGLTWLALRLDLGLDGLATVSLITRLGYALAVTSLGRPGTSWRSELRLATGLALPVILGCGLVYLLAA